MHIVWDMHRVYTNIQSVSLENTLVYTDMYMKFTHAKVHQHIHIIYTYIIDTYINQLVKHTHTI